MRASVVLTALAALLVGCGADRTVDPVDAQQVASKTGGAASAKLELRMELDAGDQALSQEEEEELAAMTFSARGVIGEHGRLMRVTYVFPAGAFGVDKPGDVTFEAILDADAGDMYVQYSKEIGIELPPGKSWMHIRDESLQGFQQSNDPSQMVAYLNAAGELDRVGEEQVRGVDTVRYSATIDVEKAAQNVGGGMGEDLKKSLEGLKELGIREIPMDVWIDDDSYLRRLDLDWELPGKKGARMQVELELWDFGEPVDVRLPPESKVVEQEDLEG
jgi:hypothetical protein